MVITRRVLPHFFLLVTNPFLPFSYVENVISPSLSEIASIPVHPLDPAPNPGSLREALSKPSSPMCPFMASQHMNKKSSCFQHNFKLAQDIFLLREKKNTKYMELTELEQRHNHPDRNLGRKKRRKELRTQFSVLGVQHL